MVGSMVGAYTLTGVIGQGGMGVVYAAKHGLLGRQAAIKVLQPEMTRSKDNVERFFNEARAATSIRHPSIVEIYDFGHLPDGAAYIAMEFLEGENLGARLGARRRLPIGDALWLARQVSGALGAAHAKGIIHRDLKPDNVFLVGDPEVVTGERIKLLDFGIAKLSHDDRPASRKTRTGAVMGTPTYMSPEQCRGVEIDSRADIYSLGCLLFEMLTGKPPFGGEGMGDVLAAHITKPPPKPSSRVAEIPASVDRLVLHLLAKDPRDRVQTAEQAIALIDELAFAPSPGTPSRPASAGAVVYPTTPPGGSRATNPARPRPGGSQPPPYAMAMGPGTAPTMLANPTTLTGAARSMQTGLPERSRRGLMIGGAAVAVASIALLVLVINLSSKPSKAAEASGPGVLGVHAEAPTPTVTTIPPPTPSRPATIPAANTQPSTPTTPPVATAKTPTAASTPSAAAKTSAAKPIKKPTKGKGKKPRKRDVDKPPAEERDGAFNPFE